jgi:hypothetical protein
MSEWSDAELQLDGNGQLGLIRWYDGETTQHRDIGFLWKRCLLVEHILGIKNSEEIDALYEELIGDDEHE